MPMTRPQTKPRRRTRWVAAATIVLAAAIGSAGIWWWLRPGTPKIDPNDTAQVALGQGMYAAQCARCHGANLEGQPNWQVELPGRGRPAPPHDAHGHTWH